MMASVTVQRSKERTHFAAVWKNDGSVEWIDDIPHSKRREEAVELVERWLKGEVEGIYLGRRPAAISEG